MLLALTLLTLGLGVGVIGSLTGIGGGIVLVPVLSLVLHIPMHFAMGVSLMAVVAQSTGSAAAVSREAFTNNHVAVFLETASSVGAFLGAVATAYVPIQILSLCFGLLLLFAGYNALRRDPLSRDLESGATDNGGWAERLNLKGRYLELGQERAYQAVSVWKGWGTMAGAGFLSGLLGVGAGAVKVLAMDQVMRLPYRVSTATSSFIVGITAAVGIGVYLRHGFINVDIAAPVVAGIAVGAVIGGRLLVRAPLKPLRMLFSAVVLGFGIMMVGRGLGW